MDLGSPGFPANPNLLRYDDLDGSGAIDGTETDLNNNGLVDGVDSGGSAAGFGGPSLANAYGAHANYLEIIKPTLLLEASKK